MTVPDPLPREPQQLHHSCDPEQFAFRATAELEGLTGLMGQIRAMDAVRFGAMREHGPTRRSQK